MAENVKTASQQVAALAETVGTDIKSILAHIGDVSKLTTTQKASLVVAINELKSAINSIDLTAIISDSTTTVSSTWSSSKINNAINSAIANLVNGAPDTMDTLKELSDAIAANKDTIATLEGIASGHVKYDGAQSLTAAQQAQARTNISAASTTDLNTVKTTANSALSKANTNAIAIGTLNNLKTTAKSDLVSAANELLTGVNAAKSAASAAQSTANTGVANAKTAQDAIDALSAAIGDTSTDYVAVYTSARDGTA